MHRLLRLIHGLDAKLPKRARGDGVAQNLDDYFEDSVF